MSAPWPTRKLREIADIRVSNVDKQSHLSEEPVRLCNYMDVYSNDYVTGRIDFMEATATKGEIERFGLKAWDVAITKDSETPDDIGIPAVITETVPNLVCGYHLALIRPKSELLDPIYLAKQLATSDVTKYFALNASGSTRYGLPIGAIESVEIPTPPKPEQTKIAEILSTVDRAIEQTEALIAKQQRLKTGLMQYLLTRGIDEHGRIRSEETHEFKDSPLGRIPVEWEVCRLDELLAKVDPPMRSGPFGSALLKDELVESGVPLLGIDNVEIEFGAENYNNQFDEFMRYFLVIHTGSYSIRRSDVYNEFKSHSRKHEVEALLASLKSFARYFCAIALGKEKDPQLADAFHDIRELRADVCYPLLMEVYADYSKQLLSKPEFLEIILMVESYVFRRAVCDIPTNSLRQTFATFQRKLKKDRYLESVKANFLLLPSYRRFPGDEEFQRQIQVRNLYQFNRRSYWLRRFENHDRKERVMVQDYTIEHILPQNENLNAAWRAELGEDWKRIRAQYLHTLGNLTLTGYNSEYSDRSFAEKRDMEGGFKQSPLRLNEGLGSCESWNEAAIQKRAALLAARATKIWGAPSLPDDILKDYQETGTEKPEYTLAHHHYLDGGISRELFDAFRAEVLALDECVREVILKLYIAFKAETNFVDVIPQAKRLLLILNLDFPEVDDPRKICRDVTGMGRWGNGNTEVFFEKMEELPYIIGLVRQSLEKQLGDEESEATLA